jgi:chitodextrinase/regulation of enolase protein 1 (concanavalin A-like superfamily)
VSNLAATSLTLSWTASTNAGSSGVGGYYVYRNGSTTPLATVTSGTSFNDSGLTAATTYSYQVAAFDTSSPPNVSAPSTALSVTTSTAVAAGWSSGDIGTVGIAGSYSLSGATYTVNGSGGDIWNAADAFQFVSQPLTGDGSITARVVSQSNTDPWAKAGIMFRETLAAGATNAFAAVTIGNGVIFSDRATTAAASVISYGPHSAAPYWLRVVRAGSTFTAYASPDGNTWTQYGQYTITMASQAYVGLAVTSHNNATLGTAVFDNVTVLAAAPPVPDTQAPTVPTGLAVSNLAATSLTLSWTASTDLPNPGGSGVGGYYVYRNGSTTPLATVTSGTSFNDSGLSATTTYSYQVAAFDKASPVNVSAPSTALSVTTSAAVASGWSGGDIGAVTAAGSYSLSGGTFTVLGSGADIWNAADEFQFVSESLTGDGSITARVVSQSNTNVWAKAGVMFRETLAAGATNAFAAITPSSGVVYQVRPTTGAASFDVTYGPIVATPYWVRMVRAGNLFTAYYSPDGNTWTSLGQDTITMASQAYVGLAVSSHANGTLSTAVFDNVTIAGQIALTLAPRVAAITQSQSQQFTATVSGGGAATWTVDGIAGGNSAVGTITAAGLYTPGSAAGAHTIVATSVANPSLTGSATVAVTGLSGVYTYHNDLSRDGANSQEYALTAANVTKGSFGKLFSCPVDGAVYAQPLWVANVSVNGTKHNVVYVATQHDSLYAFDADANPCVTLWKVSLIDTAHGATGGEATVPSGVPGYLVGQGFGDITPEVGVTGTPVIDPASGTFYVVSKSMNSAGTTFYQRLHAIDVTSGSEKGTPVAISGSVPGTGDFGSTVTFSSRQENQRPGLALVNGTVYIGWSSHEDTYPWHGWLMGYTFNGSSFTQSAIFNVTPNGVYGGIWMGGGAPAADSSNNLYVLTGNGVFDANSSSAPNNDYGDSLLKLTSNLKVSEYFTPSDQLSDYDNDNDFGSGGAAVLADLPAGSPLTHLVMGGGKDGTIYVLNRDLLGGLGDANAVEPINFGYGIYATGAYWNNYYYLVGINGPLVAYLLNTAVPKFTLAASSSNTYGFPGSSPSVSAAGTANGIVWTVDNSNYCTSQSPACGPAVLHAYNATNVKSELWNSSMVSTDAAGNAVKFAVPTIANGKVYLGTRGNNSGGTYGSTTVSGELDVYGLNSN